ncbi:MAG: preprotein translocase subunit SecG [Patescibacteria group bacterium]
MPTANHQHLLLWMRFAIVWVVQLIGNILPWAQNIVAIAVMAAVLLQQSDEALSSAFGGSGSGVWRTKRGLEKTLFVLTISLAVIFILLAVLNLFITS